MLTSIEKFQHLKEDLPEKILPEDKVEKYFSLIN